jgi:predicted NUDIX family phosphoesterase
LINNRSEKVLVFPEKILESIGYPQGFDPECKKYLDLIFQSKPLFIDREEAETDPSYKQIIPYQVIRQKKKFFIYRRGKSGSENRLKKKLSLGIGGHVNDNDQYNHNHNQNDNFETIYNRGREREFFEEVTIFKKDQD